MSNLYDDFEKRFTSAWFSSGWQEVEKTEPMKGEIQTRKSLDILNSELETLQDNMEKICAKELMLNNLSKFYSGDLT
jgi:hypothetical protein